LRLQSLLGMNRLAALALILIAPSIPRPTGACSALAENSGPLELDAAFAADAVPPSAVIASVSIDADDGDGGGGGGCGTPLCGDGGHFVVLNVSATDDQAPAQRIGYRLAVVGGQAPEGMTIPSTAVLSDNGDLLLRFLNTTSAFAFDLEIRAVDLNGNIGPATVLAVVHSS
jgi:hypothetical protein